MVTYNNIKTGDIMSNNTNKLQTGSTREILKIGIPLMIASSGNALKLFTDRVMLSHYDGLALAASLGAGVIYFTLVCLWLGASSYTSNFVAQYIGANKERRVGLAVWQGVFLSLIGGVVVGSGYFWGEWFFKILGHNPKQMEFEIPYFQILCAGAVFFIMTNALLAFWNGRGKTWMVTAQEAISTTINVGVNYVLIFGNDDLGIKAMGVKGAAFGTVISGFCGFLFTFLLFIRKKHRNRYKTLPRRPFNLPIFRRVVRFGLPSGVQFFLDITSFSIFIHLLALMGTTISIASTIAFSLNAILFIPLTSIGVTASIFVAQGIGSSNIKLALQATRNCLNIVIVYIVIMAVLFILFPQELMGLFPLKGTKDTAAVYHAAGKMLQYMLYFFLFDGLFILYNSAIKGAGDTKFSMYIGTLMGWFCFAIPSYIAVKFFDATPWTLWKILVAYVVIAGVTFYLRYRQGKWQKMKIIE